MKYLGFLNASTFGNKLLFVANFFHCFAWILCLIKPLLLQRNEGSTPTWPFIWKPVCKVVSATEEEDGHGMDEQVDDNEFDESDSDDEPEPKKSKERNV